MTKLWIAAAAVAVTLISSAALAETVHMKATLTGAAQVPPLQTDGKGTADVTVDTTTKKVTWKIEYTGLSGPAVAAHFHGPADASKNAGVEVPIAPAGPSPVSGTATITDDELKQLMGGMMYINVHTKAHPAGEIRGQVEKQ
jgi:hypothetical protein